MIDSVQGWVAFLREAARYFERRPTGGEDIAHWANVYNAQNCREISDYLSALDDSRKDGASPPTSTEPL